MRFQASISVADSIGEVATELCASAGDLKPDLAALWVSHHYGPEYDSLVSEVRETLGPRNLIGCTAESVVGSDREVEDAPAAVLWVAELPEARILPFVLDQQDLSTLSTADEWRDRLGVHPDDRPTFLVFPEPYTIQFGIALNAMDDSFGGAPIIGGVASGAKNAGENRLFLNDQILRQGMVGVSISGPIGVSTLVSQGCRPIGSPFVITKAESNLIYELGGRDAFAVLKEVHNAAAPADRTLMRNGLHVGRVIDEHRDHFGPGDFLIRNIVGVVDNQGLAMTDHFRAGQTVQFHVRDASTADEELRSMLRSKVVDLGSDPLGGLVFCCNGRGTRMFADENHDIQLINEIMPTCQMAGFFAAGEIGPIGGKSFIHGFTSCLVLFHKA